MPRVRKNVLGAIGRTPLVRLNRITQGLSPRIFAKLEFLNPGGSVKDRIGYAMVNEAEQAGLLTPGGTIVEPTSGNTGIGLAMVAALRGYKMVFTMADKQSTEKQNLLRLFGAKVVVGPTAVDPTSPHSYYNVAKRIVGETPRAYLPNQYTNDANPRIHYETTGPEIWQQTRGKVTVVVIGIGTGGTITGVAKYLKEHNPRIRVVGVDPEGSMFYPLYYGLKVAPHPYRIEGIGEDFMPRVLDLSVADEIIQVSDQDAFLTARRLARLEGLLVGSSSGAAVHATLQVARRLSARDYVVVILPDRGDRYLTKFFDDEWMGRQGFLTT